MLILITFFKTDKSIDYYTETDENSFWLDSDFNDAIYKVENDAIKCLNCMDDEDNFDEDENSQENDSVDAKKHKRKHREHEIKINY